MIRLKTPDSKDKKSVLEFKNDFLSHDNSCKHISGARYLADHSYEEWLKHIDLYAENPPDGMVRSTQFIAYTDTDTVVGVIQLRHALNNFLLLEGGHIGYAVRPSERKKGYATEMLRLCLEKARALKLESVLLTCDETNIGSEKTIRNLGGIYENSVAVKDAGLTKRFWIKL